jgi:hypothetical protein
VISVPDFAADHWHIGRMVSFSAWVLELEVEVEVVVVIWRRWRGRTWDSSLSLIWPR